MLLGLIMPGMVIGVLHSRSLETGKPFLIQDAVRTVLAPPSHAFRALFAAGGKGVRVVRPRWAILGENERLRKEVQRLTRENSKLREAAEENVRLRQALGLRQSTSLEMVAAEVISRKESSWFDTATIDCGRDVGIEKGSAVVNYRGLVGQVLQVDAYTSQMVFLTDPNSAVGAMVQRSRTSGMLCGQGADYLVLSYLPKDADVKVSDVVVSSGMGRVIPKGVVIGRVVKVKFNSVVGTTTALVRPSVRFDQVEQVLVVKPGQVVPE